MGRTALHCFLATRSTALWRMGLSCSRRSLRNQQHATDLAMLFDVALVKRGRGVNIGGGGSLHSTAWTTMGGWGGRDAPGSAFQLASQITRSAIGSSGTRVGKTKWELPWHRPGGRLQLVLMRHPPQLSVKTCQGGGGGGGRVGGGVLAAWPGGGGGCAQPTTTTCIPQGGVYVWGHGV